MIDLRKMKVSKGSINGYEFMYNPEEFRDSISVAWNETQGSGMNYPDYMYGGGETRTVDFTLYVTDAKQEGYTRKFISQLHTLIPPAGNRGLQFKANKPVIFSLGWFVKDVLVASYNITYTGFSPDLQPTEAVIDVSLIILQAWGR